jgi:hypothetical protein
VAQTVNGDEPVGEAAAAVDGGGAVCGLRPGAGAESTVLSLVLGRVTDPGAEASRSAPLVGDWIWGDTIRLSDGAYEWRVILW